MKRIALFLGLALTLAGQAFAAEVIETPDTLKIDSGEVYGSLMLPADTGGKVPVVLLIAGSGPTDRDGNNPAMKNNSLKMLAEGLAANGIASLRYDKRGIAASRAAGADESELRFEMYIDDAKAWAEKLRADGRFSEVIIAGHSEGSLIGMVASQDEAVSGFISLEGCASTAGKILRRQIGEQAPTMLNEIEPYLKELEQGKTVDGVPESLYSLFRPSVQPYMISWLKYDPCEEIAALDKPTLIVQGTTDVQVRASEAFKLSAAKRDAKLVVIDGMNHILKSAPADMAANMQTYTDPDLPLADGLMAAIVKFIKG